jgi:hypothetical protein
MPPELAAQLDQTLQAATDPTKLDELAAHLANSGYPLAAGILRGAAMAMRAKESVADTARAVADAISQPAAAEAEPGPTPAQQTTAEARTVVEQISEIAKAAPSLAPAAAEAAQAAQTAAAAAVHASPTEALEAAQQAAKAAESAMSSEAAEAAARAVEVAKEAILTQNPAAAQAAAALAVDSLRTATVELEKLRQNGGNAIPEPSAPPPVESRAAELAAMVRENIKSAGCWKEDRNLVREYQAAEGGTATTRGRAGLADGMYGPTTALAMMSHLPKVPQPCYWPSDAKRKADAQRQWKELISAGKVTIGGQRGAVYA